MLPISTKTLVDFIPKTENQGEAPPVFKLAALSLAQRAHYRHELALAGARYISPQECADAFRESIKKYVAPEKQEEAHQLLEGKNPEKLAKLESELLLSDNELAILNGRREFYTELSIITAAKYALRGWENYSAPYSCGGNGMISDVAFDSLPAALVIQIGLRALELMSPTQAQVKN